jgi:hypothetical protein
MVLMLNHVGVRYRSPQPTLLKKFPSILGGEASKDWIREKFQHLRHQGEIPHSRELAQGPGRIVDLV